MIKLNQLAKYLGQRSCSFKVIVQTQCHTANSIVPFGL